MNGSTDLATLPREIVLLQQAARYLAECTQLDEVKNLIDKAEALRVYTRQAEDGLEAQNAAAEIKIRAQRRAGEILADMPKNPGGRPNKENQVQAGPGFGIPSLADLGIGKAAADRWRSISRLPDDDFEAFITATKEAERELTTAAALKLARQRQAQEPPEPPGWDELKAIAHLERAYERALQGAPPKGRDSVIRRMHRLYPLSECAEPEPSNGRASINALFPVNGRAKPEALPALRYGSVCSGIEAATVAWKPLGWQPEFFAEIAEFPSAVLSHHYPEVPNHGDFTRIECEPGTIDLLVGGTPCQSFSIAGLRKGLNDDRGNLALEFLRLAQRARPSWLVWENVPGVLSTNSGRDFGAFLGGLAELGYGWAYRILDARYFGVPQRRRRIFVVGHLGDWRPATAALFDSRVVSVGSRQMEETRQASPFRLEAGPSSNREKGGIRAYGLNGDVTPKFGRDVMPTLRAQQGGEGFWSVVVPGVMPPRRITPVEAERLQGFPENYTRIPYQGKAASECPDNPRRFALGNSMAVPVMAWIGRRIQYVEAVRQAV